MFLHFPDAQKIAKMKNFLNNDSDTILNINSTIKVTLNPTYLIQKPFIEALLAERGIIVSHESITLSGFQDECV